MKPLAAETARTRAAELKEIGDAIEAGDLIKAADTIGDLIGYLGMLGKQVTGWLAERERRRAATVGVITDDDTGDDIAIRTVELAVVCREDDTKDVARHLSDATMQHYVVNCGASVRLATEDEARKASAEFFEQ